jgi:hypothetical protein
VRGGSRWGAGRPGRHLKAEQCLRIDVRVWHRAGSLRQGYRGSWSWSRDGEPAGSIGYSVEANAVRLSYSSDDLPIRQVVQLEHSPCHFGGTRTWFRCPSCFGRSAVLYFRHRCFSCRRCQRLVYSCQSEDWIARTWRRQRKLEAKLNDGWNRPKGMHSRTREHIVDAIIQCEELREHGLAQFLERLRLA